MKECLKNEDLGSDIVKECLKNEDLGSDIVKKRGNIVKNSSKY